MNGFSTNNSLCNRKCWSVKTTMARPPQLGLQEDQIRNSSIPFMLYIIATVCGSSAVLVQDLGSWPDPGRQKCPTKKIVLKSCIFVLLGGLKLGVIQSSVADPGCLSRMRFFHPGSRFEKIPDPGSGSSSKNLSIFTPKNCFLSFWKYDQGCSSRVRILIFYLSRIQGSKSHRIPEPDQEHCFTEYMSRQSGEEKPGAPT